MLLRSLFCVFLLCSSACAGSGPDLWLGYTEMRTDLAGGRHANVRTMRAVISRADGSERQVLGEALIDQPDAWTQFVGWSPDGKSAILHRGWNEAENAKWEEEHKQFRMEPGKWLLDSYLYEMNTKRLTNVTATERVSHYNGGLFYLPDHRGLGFTPLIGGISKPFVMDLDGRHKRDVSGGPGGFTYGYSASPDGKRISYHENYQVYLANADGTAKQKIETGQPFNFGPTWSPDGRWLLFVSGEHYNCHPYVVGADGKGLRKLADRAGYRGVIEFLDVFDYHAGSSDTPTWSFDGKSVYYTGQVGKNVELFAVDLSGHVQRLTTTHEGSLHYHPTPSPDGKWLVYGSKRDGVRQLFAMQLSDRSEHQITHLTKGHAAMWPRWRTSEQR